MAGASLALGSKALADGGTQIPAASALPLTYRQRDAHRHPDRGRLLCCGGHGVFHFPQSRFRHHLRILFPILTVEQL